MKEVIEQLKKETAFNKEAGQGRDWSKEIETLENVKIKSPLENTVTYHELLETVLEIDKILNLITGDKTRLIAHEIQKVISKIYTKTAE